MSSGNLVLSTGRCQLQLGIKVSKVQRQLRVTVTDWGLFLSGANGANVPEITRLSECCLVILSCPVLRAPGPLTVPQRISTLPKSQF